MSTWALLLGGLVVWAIHFFLAYAFASIFPGREVVRWLTVGATVAALIADGLILRYALAQRQATDELGVWKANVGATGAAVSLVSVAWQGFPAVFA